MLMNRMKLILAVMILNAARPAVASAEPRILPHHEGDYVVLLHGLGRTALSMKKLEWALAKDNYRVINLSFPSTRLSIEDAANSYLDEALRKRVNDQTVKIHFVTHSWGGIVLRQYLSNHKIENLGRVVMLAPPNHGSELADKLKNNCFYRFFTGPSGQQLGAGASSLPNQLGPADFELGIIAGDCTLNPLFSAWIPGLDDGKVSVRSTQLEGMQDFLVVHHSHTWLGWNGGVTLAVVQFLNTGHFTQKRTERIGFAPE
jgi:triacylglycerol lipase